MKIGTLLAVLVSAVAVIAVAASIALHPPGEVRQHRIDGERQQDLNIIQGQVSSYWTVNHELPKDLSGLAGRGASVKHDRDPETGKPYEYEVTGKGSYKLCAVFSTATEDAAGEEGYLCCSMNNNSNHPAGHYCFDYNVGKQSTGLPPPP